MVEIHSKAKTFLTIIAVSLVALSSFQLIFTIFYAAKDQIIWVLLNLLYDIGFLYAIVRQWELGLKIYNIAVLVVVVLSAIAFILCFYVMIAGSEPKVERNIGELTSVIAVYMLFYIMQAYLLRKYLSQIDYNEGYSIHP